jgi:hypothetical protein
VVQEPTSARVSVRVISIKEMSVYSVRSSIISVCVCVCVSAGWEGQCFILCGGVEAPLGSQIISCKNGAKKSLSAPLRSVFPILVLAQLWLFFGPPIYCNMSYGIQQSC